MKRLPLGSSESVEGASAMAIVPKAKPENMSLSEEEENKVDSTPSALLPKVILLPASRVTYAERVSLSVEYDTGEMYLFWGLLKVM